MEDTPTESVQVEETQQPIVEEETKADEPAPADASDQEAPEESSKSDVSQAAQVEADPAPAEMQTTLEGEPVDQDSSEPLDADKDPATPPKPEPEAHTEDGAAITPSQIQAMKVNDLRDALKDKGLDTKGLKADLVSRLKESYGV